MNNESEVIDKLKKKASKSRNGCLTCKKKRLKCDETKPTCLNCSKKKLACGGYATNFKWKSFNESGPSNMIINTASPFPAPGTAAATSLSASASINIKQNNLSPNQVEKLKAEPIGRSVSESSLRNSDVLKRHLELASLSVTGKSILDIKVENELISQGINPNTYSKEGSKRASFEIPVVYKNKRSYSHDTDKSSPDLLDHGYSRMRQHSKRPRSKSTNSPIDVSTYRNNLHGKASNGLASLAEVAVDEIRGRSPSVDQLEIHHQAEHILHQQHQQNLQFLNKRFHSDQSPISSTQSPFSPGFSDFLNSHHAISSSTSEGRQTSDIKPIGGSNLPSFSLVSSHTSRKETSLVHKEGTVQDGLIDLNLTPSLSALINYAFNDKENEENKFGPMFDIQPFSPLNLNNSNSTALETNTSNRILKLYNSAHSPIPVIQQHQHHDQEQEENRNLLLQVSYLSSIDISRAASPNVNTGLEQLLMNSSENEQILHLYSHYTCLIMSIKNGPKENPWRTLIIPLAKTYPCLFNSIAAMTLFHLAGSNSNNSATLRARGYTYMKKCILELASGLTKMNDNKQPSSSMDCKELPSDIALTTCINLAVCECWDRQTSSGIAHLKGAKSMIQKVLNVLKNQQFIDMRRYQNSKKLEFVDDLDDNKLDRIVELKKKLVTVDEAEWERIIQENGEKLNLDSKFSIDHMCITIPQNLQFLFNAWIYFEVLAQMTTDVNNDDKGIDLVATITSISEKNKKRKSSKIRPVPSSTGSSSDLHSELSPSEKLDSSNLSSLEYKYGNGNTSNVKNPFNIFDHFETFNFNNDNIDPLLGCAQTLFPIMGKVATLISKIRRLQDEKSGDGKKGKKSHSKQGKPSQTFRNSLSTITLGTQLRQQLMEWKPTISSTMMNQGGGMFNGNGQRNNEDDGDSNSLTSWDMPSCIATAEAYRYSSLLYLHQAVPEIPSSSSHQLAEKVFILLASVPLTTNMYIIHIFPLLVSSCEADEGEEREWCLLRWKTLSEKMWIGNIDRAIEVVKEVWRRKDEETNKRNERNRENEKASFNIAGGENDVAKLTNINVQLSGLMAAINNENGNDGDELKSGINSRFHWSSVMKEWGWEVLLA